MQGTARNLNQTGAGSERSEVKLMAGPSGPKRTIPCFPKMRESFWHFCFLVINWSFQA